MIQKEIIKEKLSKMDKDELVESAKMNKLNPYKYLIYALDTLNTKGLTDEIIESVLPYSKTLPTSLYVK